MKTTMDNLESQLYEDSSQFHQLVKKTKRGLDSAGKLKEFNSLSSIEDKVSFLEKNGYCNVDLKPEVISPNLEAALKLKDEGNKLFKEGRYAEARDVYTQCLQHFPVDHANPDKNKDYAIVWANRSACLEHGGLHEAVLHDIDMAFKYGYPRELHFKIYNRKGGALFKRKQYKDAKATFQKCRDMIGKSEMPTKQREQWRIKLAKQMSVFNAAKEIINHDLPIRPWAQQAENPAKITDDSTKDLGVIATEDIKRQQIVFTEEPCASIVLDGMAKGKVCPHNFKRMPAGLPCSLGSKELFSSVSAREEAEKSYHRFEFKTLDSWSKLGLSPVSRLAFRLLTNMDPDKVGQTAKSLDSHEVLGLTVQAIKDQNDQLSLTCLILYYLKTLEIHDYFKSNKVTQTDAIMILTRAILVTAKYSMKVFHIVPPSKESDLWNVKSIPTSEYGLAIYPKFAKLRSKSRSGSVGSDVTIFYQEGKLFVQALRNAKAGQPVDIHNDADVRKEEVINDMINFRCDNKKCSLGFPLKEKTNEKVVKCPLEGCGAETNIWKRLKRIVELKKDHETARKELEDKKVVSAIEFFTDLLKEWEGMVYRPYKEITKLENDLKNAILLNNTIMEREWQDATR